MPNHCEGGSLDHRPVVPPILSPGRGLHRFVTDQPRSAGDMRAAGMTVPTTVTCFIGGFVRFSVISYVFSTKVTRYERVASLIDCVSVGVAEQRR